MNGMCWYSRIVSVPGNSGYGKTVTNKERHCDIKFATDVEAPDLVNDPRFRVLNPLHENLYEVELNKKTIRLDLPLHIGFFVYQYAKLKMLQFHYQFLDKFVDRRDYQLCEMDTDSEYMALTAEKLEDVVKPEKRREFFETWPQWLPAQACSVHHQDFVDTKCRGETWEATEPCCLDRQQYDKRTPGLFKVEYDGHGIVALCSKTYYCFGPTSDKLSCKGISKRQNDLTRKTYLDVLENKESGCGTNRGFRVRDNQVLTYTQTRAGLSYLYPKRKVAADGVSTRPLDL